LIRFGRRSASFQLAPGIVGGKLHVYAIGIGDVQVLAAGVIAIRDAVLAEIAVDVRDLVAFDAGGEMVHAEGFAALFDGDVAGAELDVTPLGFVVFPDGSAEYAGV
jgi:hypothetical protein